MMTWTAEPERLQRGRRTATRRGAALACFFLLISVLFPTQGRAQTRGELSTPIVFVANATLAAFMIDSAVRTLAMRQDPDDTEVLAALGTRLGDGRLYLPGLGLAYGAAALGRAPMLQQHVLHVAGGVVASGVATMALKAAVGRARPSTPRTKHCHRFTRDDDCQSFPSGHTSAAFSLAAALTEEVRSPVVWVGAYSAATLVGWSRVRNDRHWLSDVIAGAALGELASRSTIRWLHHRAEKRVGMGFDGEMVVVQLRF
jgi:membrane-associated phospholipid phosphatase